MRRRAPDVVRSEVVGILYERELARAARAEHMRLFMGHGPESDAARQAQRHRLRAEALANGRPVRYQVWDLPDGYRPECDPFAPCVVEAGGKINSATKLSSASGRIDLV